MRLGKRGLVLEIIFFVVIIMILVVGVCFLFFISSKPNVIVVELKNPAQNLNDTDAVSQFNESFVFYLLYKIGAYKLHSSPFASGNPKIGFIIEETNYTAEIFSGNISVRKNLEENVDIIIRTNKQEAVKMIKDKDYIEKSFSEGMSTIDLVSSKKDLFAKGYLGLYTELTGKSVTGNIIRVLS